MARSVVLKGTVRCEKCLHPPRWCICEALRPITCPLTVDVLMHALEIARPTSTGNLLKRILPDSAQHIYRHDLPFNASALARPGKQLWILHPLGEPLPAGADPADLQVLLLDGSWPQAGEMRRAVESRGRLVRLPMSGKSRYWLRAQQGEGWFSTAEALLFLLEALGLHDACAQIRLQFELHVYAGLSARGRKLQASEFLANSPVRDALPELVAKFAPRARKT